MNRSCDACDGPWHVPFERVALALAENKFDFAGKRRTKIANANFAAVSKVELSRQIEENLRLKETEMDDDLRVRLDNDDLICYHDGIRCDLHVNMTPFDRKRLI